MLKKKLVEVTWQDPTIDAGWVDDDHHTPLTKLKSYGILIRNTPHIVIAGSYDSVQKKYADRTKFPKGCVESIRVIEVLSL